MIIEVYISHPTRLEVGFSGNPIVTVRKLALKVKILSYYL